MKPFTVILGTIGKVLLLLAGMAFITGLSLFVAGAFLATWPLLRLSPQERRIGALIGLGTAVMGMVQAYKPDTPTPDESETEPETEPGMSA